ncbi:hypothetical protein Tco_0893882 [Tanacetum coccineum]|uniref:NERD domain-containing protein n=1 Tax=Tanacetum coccineum TaxID=301880 RepID=A0ABQ5CAJ8_9ASTR
MSWNWIYPDDAFKPTGGKFQELSFKRKPNVWAYIFVKAKNTWKESTLNKRVQPTEEARLSKLTLQKWLNQFGENYSKAVMILSVVIALIGLILFKWPFFSTPGIDIAWSMNHRRLVIQLKTMTVGTKQILCNVLEGRNKAREAKTVVSNGILYTNYSQVGDPVKDHDCWHQADALSCALRKKQGSRS